MTSDPYHIQEVSGTDPAVVVLNSAFPDDFVPLQPAHLGPGTFWWLVLHGHSPVGFAGMVPFDPFPRVGYLKRAAVVAPHRGRGLQARLLLAREEKARTATDWTHLVSECSLENVASGNNFIRLGYLLVRAERPWEKETLFWRKAL